MTTRRQTLQALFALMGTPSALALARAPRLDTRARARIDALIRRMSLTELIGQLATEGAWSPRLALSDIFAANPFMPPITPELGAKLHEEQLRRVRQGQLGMLMGLMDLDTAEKAQAAAVRESRLKIPLIFAADVIHGHRTAFPIPLAEAASWDPALAERTARAAAVEATRVGLDMTFAPMVDIGRDQRWGRVAEGAGEDVWLGMQFAASRVRGFQGTDTRAKDSLLACVKHFAGYGGVESGLDYAGADLPERVLREVHLPPFRAAFDAGALATMASFNTVDGVPATGNRRLLTQLLREEFGFKGLVISDFNSINELIPHGVAANEEEAAAIALAAGCDMAMLGDIYTRHLPGLVQSGRIRRDVIEVAVRRILTVKEAAGLFDDPYRRIDRVRYEDNSTDAAHRKLARESAQKSIVLLKNEGEVLPLQRGLRRVALIGPFADDTANLNGPWGPIHVRVPPVSLAEGLRAALPASTELRIAHGCGVESDNATALQQAADLAQWADVVLLAVGESQDMSGEAASRTQVVLPAAQQRLAETLKSAGKPTVVILRHGRALALEGAIRDSQAILATWFLGTEAGHAVADVLTGLVSPSGRLPVSFPIGSGQQPFYYARAQGGRPAPLDQPLAKFTSHYRGVPNAALYPFGHGLSYCTVVYGATIVSQASLQWDGHIEVEAQIVNQGEREIEEVVQLYIHDKVASVSRPTRELKGFQKVVLKPGETRQVRFRIDRNMLSFVDAALQRRAEPGDFDTWIAPSSSEGIPAGFKLLKA